jgi:radical SAM superfamily enzyme YgiQ (UPF0313 family)
VAYLAAVLQREGISVEVLDAYALQLEANEIIRILADRSPAVVGISLLSTSYEIVSSLVNQIRSLIPHVVIVVGNLHASLYCEEILLHGVADYVVHREGEYVLLDLVRTLERGGDPTSVRGISFLDGQRVFHTEIPPLIEDLDSLPFPAWELFSRDAYRTDPRTEVVPGVTETLILATRGCPNQCTFCSSRTSRSLGPRYRMRSPENVADEMEFMHDRFGSTVFGFMDLAFPLVKSHAMGLFSEIVRRGLQRKISWMTECRVKPLDEETVAAMKKAGCVRMNFGIESGNDEVLRRLRKNFTTEDVQRAVTMANREGIEVDGMFMLGLPGETEESIRQTIELAAGLDLRYAIFNLFVPYPGCELFDQLKQEGKLNYESWAQFTSYGGYSGLDPVYVPDGLTPKRLTELQKFAMRRFYLRPRFILQELKRANWSKARHYVNGLASVILGK